MTTVELRSDWCAEVPSRSSVQLSFYIHPDLFLMRGWLHGSRNETNPDPTLLQRIQRSLVKLSWLCKLSSVVFVQTNHNNIVALQFLHSVA